MKTITICLSLFLCINTFSQLQNASALLVENTNTTENKALYKEVTISANIVYPVNMIGLPKEAIAYSIEFAKRKNYINGIYRLGKKHFPKINKTFAKYNVPTELNVLIALESYFNKNVISKAGAVGYWQFMDATAVEYGLNIDSTKDERKDFTKSTKAAARYLKNQYNVLHDWYLTAASYNCGIGNVKKAIAKSGLKNPNFFDIKSFLPKETQNYVMNYIALNIMLKNYNLLATNKLQWETVTQKVMLNESDTKLTTAESLQ